jgi:hypothetical protein
MAANKPKAAGRHPDIEAIDRKLHELQFKSKHKDRWQDDRLSKAFSAFKQTLIIGSALEIAAHESFGTRSAFAGMLFRKMKLAGTLPRRNAGRGVQRLKFTPWDEGTFTSYLRDGTVEPTPAEIGQILETAIALAEETLARKERYGPQIRQLLARGHRAPSECLESLLGNLAPPPPEAFRAEPPYVSVFGQGFDVPPRATWSQPLEATAAKIREELISRDGARLALVTGPHLSGKKTSLKFLCRQLNYDFLYPDDGSRIPLLALALDELAPGEFVDSVFKFFRNGDPSAVVTPESDEGLTVAAKIEQIQRLSKIRPACVILADVAPLENDELIRSLHQDHVAQVIISLFEGEPRTRIVLTAHENDTLRAIEDGAGHRDIKKATFPLPGTVMVDPNNLRILEDASATGFEVSGITKHLADIALQRSGMRHGAGARGFRHRIMLSVERNDPWKILDLLWAELLVAHERFLLGAVASSLDGLRVSLVARMAKTLALRRPEPWIGELTTEHHVEKVLENLTDLVQLRQASLDLGQRGWRQPSTEALLFMDQGWRRRVLSLWFKHDAEMARECRWLVAREAANQARTFKAVGGLINAKNAFARDLQSFDALIGSIDPKEIMEPAATGDAWSMERRILPDLDENAPKPNALTVLRYAFQRWYADYLEGEDFKLLSELDDPDLRLRLLLPFFDPSHPWMKLDERRLCRKLEKYPQVRAAFPGKKILPLLTAIALASLRVQRFDLLRSAVRMGEQVLDAEDCTPADIWAAFRLLRAEIDAGLYGGGNPDEVLPMRPGEKSPRETELASERSHQSDPAAGPRIANQDLTVSEIIRYILEVISKRCALKEAEPAEMLIARGKMLTRLGEAYHMSGKMRLAQLTFQRVMASEDQLAIIRGEGSCAGTILGGRGARACISFLVDSARRREWIRDRPKLPLGNGLILPLPPVVPVGDDLLGKARALVLINLRRIGAFDTAERLGVRMDEARLAAARGEYLLALELLKITESTRLRPGANVELSMELHALHTRVLLEAALFMTMFEMGLASDRVSKWMEELLKGRETEPGSEHQPMSDELVDLAEQSLRSFQRLVSTRTAVMLPFGTLFRYFTVWLDVLKVRNSTTAELLEKVVEINGKLENVIIHMDQAHFRRFAQEADLLKQGLDEFVCAQTIDVKACGRE